MLAPRQEVIFTINIKLHECPKETGLEITDGPGPVNYGFGLVICNERVPLG